MIRQTQPTNRSRACGCSAGCHCTCNSATCEPACDTGISRPNFFAGQLLTDDDLRAALNYVVEKNRLHNRHFMGDGVVCGLEVKHHPCPDTQRKVIVKPGHALDCCGNDIVVQCEEELDILNMVRELRAKLRGGVDCGDPCAEQPLLFSIKNTALSKDLDGGVISRLIRDEFNDNRFSLSQDAVVVVLDKGRKWRIGSSIQFVIQKGSNALNVYYFGQEETTVYDLYLRYRECGYDLVSPFQVEDCTTSSCKPSRIRESYSFELSCNESTPDDETLQDRLKKFNDIIPDHDRIQGETLHGFRMLETAEQVLVQYQEVMSQLIPDNTIGADNRKKLYDAIRAVNAPAVNPNPTIDKQVESADEINRFLTLVSRAFHSQIHAKLAAEPGPTGPPPIPTLLGHIKTQIDQIGLDLITIETFTPDPDKVPVDISVVKLLQARAAILKTAVDNNTAISVESVESEAFDKKAQMVGELVTRDITQKAVDRLDKIHEQLTELIRLGSVVVDRELRHLMGSVSLGVFASDMTDLLKSPTALKVVKSDAAIVSRAVAEIAKSRLCEFVLPPCPPCNDERVLIARVTVEACEVIDICNVVRKFVIAGPSLRYWFADFGILNSVRGSCCSSPKDIVIAKQEEQDRLGQQNKEWKSQAGDPAFSPQLKDRVNNPAQWKGLKADIDKLSQSAVEPTGVDLIKEDDLGPNPDPLAVSKAISKLSGRPAADIQSILDRTDGTTTAELRREFEPKIENAVSTSSEARATAARAENIAGGFADDIVSLKNEVGPFGASRIDAIEAEVGPAVSSRIDALEALANPALITRITTLETEVGPAGASRIDALEVEVGPAGGSRIDDHQARLLALETEVGPAGASRIDDHENRITNIEGEVADPTGAASSQIAANKANISTEKGRITNLRTDFTNFKDNDFVNLKEHYREHEATEHPPKDHGFPPPP